VGGKGGSQQLMPDGRQLEFFLLRYAPEAVTDEFVNLGVVLMTPDRSYADVRFTRDWSRLRCLDSDVDLEMLQSFEREFRHQLQSQEERARILKRLQDSFSNSIRLSEVKACLAENPAQELEALAKIYLETARKEKPQRETGGRLRIVARMREAFMAAGVWPLLWRKIPAATYGRPGDPLKIDCGYKPNGVVRMFHGVAIADDADAAKVLAFSYPEVRAGIARELKASCELTAIVDSDESGFARETLERAEIRMAGVTQLAEIAERARREML
jgi:hypothetical protein